MRLERIRGTPTPKKTAAGSLSDGPSVPSSSSKDRSRVFPLARKKKSIDSAEVPVKGDAASGLGQKKGHAETEKGLSCSDCGARFRLR